MKQVYFSTLEELFTWVDQKAITQFAIVRESSLWVVSYPASRD